MSVSILLLTYNRISTVMRCLKSLYPSLQGGVTWHVLDNGSTDKTPEWLLKLKHPQIKVYLSSSNLGVAGGRDFLLNKTKDDVVGFLDSDVDILDPIWLTKICKALENKRVGVVGHMGHRLYKNGILRPFSHEYEGEVDVLSGYCQFFRRRDLRKHKIELDQQFNVGGAEDDDFCLQWQSKGFYNVKLVLPVLHEWGQTWEGKHYQRNRQLFVKKWATYLESTKLDYTPAHLGE